MAIFVAFSNVLPLTVMGAVPQVLPVELLKFMVGE
jgi:hypothetical protein